MRLLGQREPPGAQGVGKDSRDSEGISGASLSRPCRHATSDPAVAAAIRRRRRRAGSPHAAGQLVHLRRPWACCHPHCSAMATVSGCRSEAQPRRR